MAGGPTQTQPQTRGLESPALQGALQEWYLVAGGASALRMTPGLTVGESDSGALTLNDPDAANHWIEFVLADNGEPWATIVTRDKSLRVAGTNCLRHPLPVGATVRLPNNSLHISRDIRMPQLSGMVVEVVHRDIPERPQVLTEWEEALATVQEPGTPAAEIPETSDPTESATRHAEERPEPDRGARDDWSDDTLMTAEPQPSTRRPHSDVRRRKVAVMAGALALGAVTLAGVVAVLVSVDQREAVRLASFDPVPLDAVSVASPVETPVPAESSRGTSLLITDPIPARAEVADGGSATQAPGPAPSRRAETADSRAPPPATAIVSAEPAPTAREPEQLAMLSRTEPELPAPVERTPVERRSNAPVEQPDAQSAAEADPETTDSGPDAAVVAELEEIGETAQTLATELARRRDLLAADLALAQGRLTSPPEASAYTLYNRVLAVDPGSPEATSGLESVRQGLINRALAQLAGDTLDDARRTLQAAADAGANPLLIADLSAEIDYRQQVIDAR